MILVIALAIWALAALPIAIALGRLCGETAKPKGANALSANSVDGEPGKVRSV